MRNKLAALIAAVMICSAVLTACGDASSQTDESKTTENSSVSDSSSSLDSSSAAESSSQSENSSESSSESSSENETDSSSQTETTTTTQSTTTTSAQETTTTTSTKAATTTTTARATQSTAKPVVTTKAATKATAKQTTKATTKATQQTNSSFTIPSNATTLQKALYNLCMGNNVSGNAKTAQQEFIKYGKQKMPNYKTSAYLHPFVDKNGKYSDLYNPNFEYADGVEFYWVHQIYTGEENPQKDWESALFYEQEIKKQIDNHAYNLKTDPYPNEILWYVTFGIKACEVDIVVLNGSTLDWKY